jgi:hypothetical protein
VLFAYLENLTTLLSADGGDSSAPSLARQEYERMLQIARQSKDDLVAVGYDEFAVESFHEVFSVTAYRRVL